MLCIIKNQKAIAIRSREYPEGVFRIPTGGINYGEDTNGNLLVDALEDEVSEVKLCKKEQLKEIANHLLGLNSYWDDWGQFRYETTIFAYNSLKNKI
ncbi:MAG: hypothetical protein KAG94_03410 [Clostridiales bacterium]|nr:hypothetical protein [Clostridiales bacterium]